MRNLCLVAILVIAACSGSGLAMAGDSAFMTSTIGSDSSTDICPTSSDSGISEDATILARRLHQMLTDELIMDDPSLQELGREIDLVLTHIRNRHPRTNEISARQWHRPSVLLLELEGDLLDAVIEHWKNGNVGPLPRIGHAAFDELNARIGLRKAEALPAFSTVIMSFGKLANLRAAREAYAAMEGVRRASFDESLGDGPDIVAVNPGGTWYVAMRNAWGDCPSGCIDSETFFFIVKRGQIKQVERREAENIPRFRALIPALEEKIWFP